MSGPSIKIGDWFMTNQQEQLEIVALDPDEGLIEVQFYDGTVEEYDFDSWEELEPSPIAPPEDWAGSYDVGKDDYGVELDRPAGGGLVNPLDKLVTDD